MDDHLPKRLLQLFFKTPLVNALLVFEDNEYFGVVLKRDVELGMRDNDFKLFENINVIDVYELPTVLFSHNITDNALIPVIDKTGNLIKIISYTEFESQFYFDEFIGGFLIDEVISNLDHPIIITNHFKKILYLNNRAFLMIGKDYLGGKFSDLIKSYDIEIVGDKMIVSKDDKMYHLSINYSATKKFAYHVYQFFLI